jgi:hypothetical protein
MAARVRKKTTTVKATRKKSAENNGGSPAHYRLSPSSASRWLVCPYSAQHGLPDEPGPAAKAGTIAHEQACAYLRGETETLLELEDEIYERTRNLIPDRAANIAAASSVYVGYISAQPGTKVFETKIEHCHIPDFGGSIDCAILYGGRLEVADLKTGKWHVSADNNPQIMSYLCLARQIFPSATEFTGTIIQPLTNKNPKTATFTGPQLDLFEKLVKIKGVSKEKQTGFHCRFCPLRPKCEEGTEYAEGRGW